MLTPNDVYPRSLAKALCARGQYVYAYYEPNSHQPFYVGKGSGNRVIDHWKAALRPSAKHKLQEDKIRSILKSGVAPHISLLAYNLDSSKEDRHTIAERVLQDAFGIQSVVEKTPGRERLTERPAVLLQKREDSASRRPLSLEAVVASHPQGNALSRDDLVTFASKQDSAILLVGLMKTYHPSYQDSHLREMARMYWNLNRLKGLSSLRRAEAILLAWTSKLCGAPVIVGAWRIDGPRAKYHAKYKRFEFPASDDFMLKRALLGRRLEGSGNNWQGQSIFVPESGGV